MTNDQPISRIVERLFSECLPPSFKPFVDRAQAEKILAEFADGIHVPCYECQGEGRSIERRALRAESELSRVRGLLQRVRQEYLHAVECVDLNCDRCEKSAGEIAALAEYRQ